MVNDHCVMLSRTSRSIECRRLAGPCLSRRSFGFWRLRRLVLSRHEQFVAFILLDVGAYAFYMGSLLRLSLLLDVGDLSQCFRHLLSSFAVILTLGCWRLRPTRLSTWAVLRLFLYAGCRRLTLYFLHGQFCFYSYLLDLL